MDDSRRPSDSRLFTDPCLGWKDSEKLIRDLASMV